MPESASEPASQRWLIDTSFTTGTARGTDAVIDALLGPELSRLKVLDVGCGTGIAARQIADRGAEVLGVEVAPRMAEIARSHDRR